MSKAKHFPTTDDTKVSKVMKKKSWSRTFPEIQVQNLRNAFWVIRQNLRYQIQYNHIGSINNLSIGGVASKIAKELLTNSFKESKTKIINSNSTSKNFTDKIDEIHKSILEMNNDFFSATKLANKFADEAKKQVQIIKEFENCSNALHLKPAMVVPKNSDKASSEKRLFIAKPTILEVILTSIVTSYYREKYVPIVFNDNQSISYMSFGSKFINKDKFSNYIHEYNSFKDVCDHNLRCYSYVKYFDLSKFFQSIPTENIVEFLSEFLYTKNKTERITKLEYKNLIRNILSFDFIKNNKIETFDKGLTIETHCQHALVNAWLMSFVKEIIENINFNGTNNIKIVSYVDDFVIFGTTEDSVERVFDKLKINFRMMGIEISEDKTSKTLYTLDSKELIKAKELVRLPSLHYLELDSCIENVEPPKYYEEDENTEIDPYYEVEEVETEDLLEKTDVKNNYEFYKELHDKFFFKREDTDKIFDIEYDLKKVRNEYKPEIFDTKAYTKRGVAFQIDCYVAIIQTQLFFKKVSISCIDVAEHFKKYKYAFNGYNNKPIPKEIVNILEYTGELNYIAYYIIADVFEIIEKIEKENNIDGLKRCTNVISIINCSNEYQKLLMRVMDFICAMQNYEEFSVYDSEKFNNTVDNLNEENLLKQMQYLYMTADKMPDRDSEVIYKLTHKIVNTYPGKIRFLASIIKRVFSTYERKKEFVNIVASANSKGVINFDDIKETINNNFLLDSNSNKSDYVKVVFSGLTEFSAEHHNYAYLFYRLLK